MITRPFLLFYSDFIDWSKVCSAFFDLQKQKII